MLTINVSDSINKTELKNLFSSVGWAENLSEDLLLLAISKSSHYVTARIDGELIGFVRSMDDNIWSANIDCLVVHKNFQHKGISKLLLKSLLCSISHIQNISVSPNSSSHISLYTDCGFVIVDDSRLLQITKNKEQ